MNLGKENQCLVEKDENHWEEVVRKQKQFSKTKNKTQKMVFKQVFFLKKKTIDLLIF